MTQTDVGGGQKWQAAVGSLLRPSSVVRASSKGCLVPRSNKTGSSCLPRVRHGSVYLGRGWVDALMCGRARVLQAQLFR
jgi:hypothetical protein